MKLNCQKGDLCRIIAAGPFRDKFIIVTEMEMYRGRPTWKYQGPLLSYKFYEAWAFYDDTLRPIRDPGEDAVDETLLWVLGKIWSRHDYRTTSRRGTQAPE